MKKIISIILASALFLAMLPVGYASAEDTTTYPGNIEVYSYLRGAGYEFGDNTDKDYPQQVTYEKTNGFWCYKFDEATTYFDFYNKDRLRATIANGDCVVIEINVPKAGWYYVKLLNLLFALKNGTNNTNACTNVEVHVLNGDVLNGNETLKDIKSKLTVDTCLTSFNMQSQNKSATPDIKNAGKCYFAEGENVIVYKRNTDVDSGQAYIYVQGIVLDGSGNAESETAATSAIMTALPGGIDSMKVGETTNVISSKVDWSNGVTVADLFGADVTTPVDGATLALETTNANVIAVDAATNSITAVAPGTATVTATVTYAGLTKTTEFDLTVTDIEADKTITIAVDDNGDGVAAVDSTKDVGDEYTVTAADRSSENLEFRGWVRGSAENGTWVSNETPYTFNVTTNTYLTAVYSAAATEANPVTEYYNWNGAYLGTEEKEPTLTGYSFREWITTKVSDILSRAVAQYDVQNTKYTVTKDGDFNISVEGDKYVYDAKVTCEAGDAVYWYRDGKCVDYGETYSFNVWGNTKITTSATGSIGAKVILDEVEKATGTTETSYMIEYDKGDKNIVEVGILFGNGFEPTVEECSEKMTSQRNDAHGQFSATSTYSNARGYLIYNDNGTYRVIYAN